MSNLFSGIHLALQSMMAHQQAIEITQHNVANANTPGYHRQEAVLVAGRPYSLAGMESGSGAGLMGTGVTLDKIQRYSVDFFDTRYRRELASSSYWSTGQAILQQMETTLHETGTDGLLVKLDAFWSGWQAVSSDPSNMTARSELLDQASSLADAFHWRMTSLQSLQANQDSAIQQRVSEINTTAEQLARLNSEITRTLSMGDQPNDLLDERDRLLDRLSEITGAAGFPQENGEVLVSIGGHALVIGSSAFTVKAEPDAAKQNLLKISWTDGQPFAATTGELKAIFDARDQDIKAQMDGLDNLARLLASAVNSQHRAGFDLNGAAGGDFFDPASVSALSLRLAAGMTDGSKLAASGSAAGVPGDGSNAILLGQIQAMKLVPANVADPLDETANPGVSTFNQFYHKQVVSLGLDALKAKTSAADRKNVVQILSQQRESVTGVSLDEEAANLVKYQRAYQAAARMMTALDEMLEIVVTQLGTVGR